MLFTIAKTQDPALKSPLRANWDGVVAEKVDAKTVRFTLRSAYAPFIENATLGILPKTLWEGVSSEEFPFSDLNTSPIGTGPFKLASISRTASGIPSAYELRPFANYVLGRPYLNSIRLQFYQSEQDLVNALEDGDIDAVGGISSAALAQIQDFPLSRAPLNRVFGVFFNQNQSAVLRDKDVRRALDMAIDRDQMVAEVLHGFGTPLEEPVPPTAVRASRTARTSTTTNALLAQQALIKAGWVLKESVLTKTTGTGKNAATEELAFTLATANVPELRAAAEYVRTVWGEMGARVNVQIFDQGDLSQNVIRPRKYDALLFGEIIGRELDLYAFWHSSQRNDPGLNIALYANSTADGLLEKMRSTTDNAKRMSLYAQFATEFKNDIPAIFLYAPDFVYSMPKDMKGVTLGSIETPSDRFLSAATWHRQIDYVWPIFQGATH